MARNPIGTTAFRCAGQAVLCIFPMERYRRWYSTFPVATETVVLFAPRMMAQYIAPSVVASASNMSVYNNKNLDRIHCEINVDGLTACLHEKFPNINSFHLLFPALSKST